MNCYQLPLPLVPPDASSSPHMEIRLFPHSAPLPVDRKPREDCTLLRPDTLLQLHTRLTEPFPTRSTEHRCLCRLRPEPSPGCLCPPRAWGTLAGSTGGQDTLAALPQSEKEKQRDQEECRHQRGLESPGGQWLAAAQSDAQGSSFKHAPKGGNSWGFSQSKGSSTTDIKPKESIWLWKSESCCLIPRQCS